MGFLRRNSNGTTSLNFLNQEENKNEKQLTIGNLCEGLDSNLYSMSSYTEDKKNKAKPSKKTTLLNEIEMVMEFRFSLLFGKWTF